MDDNKQKILNKLKEDRQKLIDVKKKNNKDFKNLTEEKEKNKKK